MASRKAVSADGSLQSLKVSSFQCKCRQANLKVCAAVSLTQSYLQFNAKVSARDRNQLCAIEAEEELEPIC